MSPLKTGGKITQDSPAITLHTKLFLLFFSGYLSIAIWLQSAIAKFVLQLLQSIAKKFAFEFHFESGGLVLRCGFDIEY